MSGKPFCDACGAKVEWHLTAAGKNIAMDPEPHPDGQFYFGSGLKLTRLRRYDNLRAGQKMYRCHWDTCPKKGQAPRRAATVRDDCERWDCTRTDRHPGHCHACGSTEHFVADCPEGA
jgi:hypothetical protein